MIKTYLPILLFVAACVLFAIHNAVAIWGDPRGWLWHSVQWAFVAVFAASMFMFGLWWRELYVDKMKGHSFFHRLEVPVTILFTIIAGAFSYIKALRYFRRRPP